MTTRPITDAPAVAAIYREDHGLGSDNDPALIVAAWPDGHVVWSGNRLQGGPPYRAGRTKPNQLASLLSGYDHDGLFDIKKTRLSHFGPDSDYISVVLKSGTKHTKLASWHELFEAGGKLVVTSHGVSTPDSSRLATLREESPEFLFFRFLYSEARGRIAELIPAEGKPVSGKLIMKAGKVTWEEITPKP